MIAKPLQDSWLHGLIHHFYNRNNTIYAESFINDNTIQPR